MNERRMHARRIKPPQFGDSERYDLFLLPVNETRRTADNQREVLPATVFFRRSFDLLNTNGLASREAPRNLLP